MFGIGAPEFFFVLIIALIVLGPDRMPGAFRQLGRWLRQLRTMTRNMKEEFAEEFAFLQEEVDMLRREAAEARAELVEIRRDLTETLQESAIDINVIGNEVVDNLRPALPEGPVSTNGVAPVTGQPISVGAPDGAGLPPLLPGDTTGPADTPADRMAQAIVETFSRNGASTTVPAIRENGRTPVKVVPPSITPSAKSGTPTPPAPPSKRLSAYAPDVSTGPIDGDTAGTPPALPREFTAHAVAKVATSPDGVEASIGAPLEPAFDNQMGGFMRLMIMQTLEKDDGTFRAEAERALRTQAERDGARARDIEDWTVKVIADAWAQKRQHLVTPGTLTVDEKASESAVIELRECPYRLEPGDTHPICDVSNTYDIEFFKQLDMKATYTRRMVDGSDHCQLIVVANAKLRRLRIKTDPAPVTAAPERSPSS